MHLSEIEKKFPLHLLVWNNEYNKLKDALDKDKSGIEHLDPRGRTPLMLGIILGHIESVRILLIHNANAFCTNLGHWTATQEAISTSDPDLVKLLIVHRDEQRVREQASIMTKVLSKLKESPDFYVELKWEFSSWLPLVSRMCPSDICRIWKSGGNVRIDTTLVGFSGTSDWVRGNLSYIFQLNDTGAIMDEVNHQEFCVYRHQVSLPIDPEAGVLSLISNSISSPPSDDFIAQKLTQPIFVTYVDTEKIEFERSKSGIWGWRSDKKETINGHDCHVYSASNVQVVTLRRLEHLPDNSKSSSDDITNAKSANPLTSLLSQAEEKCNETKIKISESTYNPNQVTIEEYFNTKVILHDRNIGRPKSMTMKVKTFKAHLSMCDDYPLSLQNQVLPIIDLMAEFNPHFQKLKDFVTMQLPAGFPMKIEIPLYHILTARITFDNLFAANQSVECVNVLRDVHEPGISMSPDRQNVHCIIDDSVFQLPSHYQITMENSPGHGGGFDEEDQMVQMAVQASLLEYGGSRQLSKRTYNLRQRSVQNTSGDFGDLDDAELQRKRCSNFPAYCTSTKHTNKRICMQNMKSYYGRNGRFGCPSCYAIVIGEFSEFLELHKSHLGQYEKHSKLNILRGNIIENITKSIVSQNDITTTQQQHQNQQIIKINEGSANNINPQEVSSASKVEKTTKLVVAINHLRDEFSKFAENSHKDLKLLARLLRKEMEERQQLKEISSKLLKMVEKREIKKKERHQMKKAEEEKRIEEKIKRRKLKDDYELDRDFELEIKERERERERKLEWIVMKGEIRSEVIGVMDEWYNNLNRQRTGGKGQGGFPSP